MQIKAIEVRTSLGGQPEEPRSDAEVTVTMRYIGSRLEASILADMLKPGSRTPPPEFWEALDYGDVKPAVPANAILHITPTLPPGAPTVCSVAPGVTTEIAMQWMVQVDGEARVVTGAVNVYVAR
jgi:hypothetical protein